MDDKQQEVFDEDAVKVWENSFKKLGIEDFEDKSFDREFGLGIQIKNHKSQTLSERHVNAILDNEITNEEIKKAIDMLQTRKAAGVDEITAEAVKKGGEELRYALLKVIQRAWNKEDIPEEWARGIIFPIYKDDERKTEWRE